MAAPQTVSVSRRTWAIHTGSSEAHDFIGILWWFGGERPKLPAHVSGNRTATWETRQAARDALKDVKPAWPNARVSRVRINLEEIA